jgi:hypothetical protein
MGYEPFSDEDIREGLKQVCERALARCAKDFTAQLACGRKQGLENMFEKAFLQSFTMKIKDWSVNAQVKRADFHTAHSERDGRIDVVATYEEADGRKEKVGIEFKVCELPRSYANAPNGVTYDIGQIAWDFGELATYRMEFGYCIAIIHGGIPAMKSATKKGVARAFHNAYLSMPKRTSTLEMPQRPTASMTFATCVKLAVVGLFVPRKKPPVKRA